MSDDLTGRQTRGRAPTVLVVEDELLIRMAIAEHLQSCGFHVIEAGNAGEAITLLSQTEIPVDLVNLGLIYSVKVNQQAKQVDIKMTLTAPACGMGPVLVGDVEYRVRKVPNVKNVNVELVFDPPWAREMMSEEAQLATGMFY